MPEAPGILPAQVTTTVVTGGAGFLGSHLCEHLLAKGHRVICVDNLETASLENISHIRGDEFVFVNHDVMEPISIDGRSRPRLPPRGDSEPDRLHAAAAPDAEDRLVRHAQRPRAREVEACALRPGLDERGLRRSADPPTARDLLGQRQPGRAAGRLRRSEAVLRGDDDGLSPPAGRRHGDRADLQHLRPAHAVERRPGDPDLHAPGVRRQAADGLRRRLADAQLLLRGRPDQRDATSWR